MVNWKDSIIHAVTLSEGFATHFWNRPGVATPQIENP